MEIVKYIFLGIVQGLTEFLPVSSSGHLVILQHFFGLTENIAFDTIVHLATALAVVLYFWRDLWQIIDLRQATSRKMFALLFLATVVTAFIGFGFKDQFEALFSSLLGVGFFLLLTGMVIIIGEKLGSGAKNLTMMSWLDALLIGLGQGAAIAPGLSRSGTTIAMALGRGLERDLAARFSFLLSLPAIAGAGLLQSKAILRAGTEGVGFWPLFLGALAAFFSALLAIRLFMELIRHHSLRAFAYYVLLLGFLVIFWVLARGL